jgi:hypothetical protein
LFNVEEIKSLSNFLLPYFQSQIHLDLFCSLSDLIQSFLVTIVEFSSWPDIIPFGLSLYDQIPLFQFLYFWDSIFEDLPDTNEIISKQNQSASKTYFMKMRMFYSKLFDC